MVRKPKTVVEYFRMLPPPWRRSLQHLRKAIHEAAPGLEECIAYDIPAFRRGERVLVCLGAARTHCSFFPGAAPLAAYADELEGFSFAKGTLRFPIGSTLPKALVKKLVRARIAEHEGRPLRRGKRARG